MRIGMRGVVIAGLWLACTDSGGDPRGTAGTAGAGDPGGGEAAVATVRAEVGLDFSGIDAFWRVHDALAAGREPGDSAWAALFSTPGYALLEERERRSGSLREAFRLAYSPAPARGGAEPAEPGGEPGGEPGAEPGGWVGYVLPHLRQVTATRDSLAAFRAELESGDLFRRGIARAAGLLPEGVTERHPPPAVSFIIFAPDGRGYRRIVLDLLHLMRSPDPVAFLAHEFHHNYRARIAREHRPFGDDLLAWALVRVENEGIADRLDKAGIPEMSDAELAERYPDPRRREYYEGYRRAYRRANEWLRWTEARLERIAAHPDSAAAIGEELHAGLPDGGRSLGSFMAATIVERLGQDRLLAVVGDPFGFWATYNEAAEASGGAGYALSEDAMRVVERVRARYVVE